MCVCVCCCCARALWHWDGGTLHTAHNVLCRVHIAIKTQPHHRMYRDICTVFIHSAHTYICWNVACVCSILSATKQPAAAAAAAPPTINSLRPGSVAVARDEHELVVCFFHFILSPFIASARSRTTLDMCGAASWACFAILHMCCLLCGVMCLYASSH